MTNTKVSIIIPTYNREKFIAECIQSAQNQKYPNIEIIVSDNASTDQTWQICQGLAQQDARIVLIRNEKNLGPVRNWMQGINKATGDYCKILFSDDCLNPDCLQKMTPKLADPDVGFVYCVAQIGPSPASASRVEYNLPTSSRISPGLFVDLLIEGKAPVSPGAILIRTKDVRKHLHLTFPTSVSHPYEKNGAGPDAMISLLTSKEYKYIEHLNEPLVFFRSHADSFTISNTNNEVTKGYQSIIPYFLKTQHGRTVWLRYMSRTWQLERRKAKSTLPMRNFLLEHEGKGSLSECLALIWHMALRPLRKRRQTDHFYTD
ncbi:glycosyltransferase family 2 protein [Aquabacterium sp.]|uniref:glycosyltransferase family 2 protein n=1 Tax=Aquabacterium sp. TaxID=1872578 RepID=UPI00248756E2|nr:glycosyltransferase family 2 protein [Aquabacterium sp.]MDI1259422.1 glycosyltransferase family 2 protein [Aquabacterium sp.]